MHIVAVAIEGGQPVGAWVQVLGLGFRTCGLGVSRPTRELLTRELLLRDPPREGMS